VVGFVGFLITRDGREYHLSEGSSAVIALNGSDSTLLEDSSSEEIVPYLHNGDQLKIVKDPVDDPLGMMRKVSVLVESGKCKGLTGTVARMWIRSTFLLRGRGPF
jgi:hypothetical protein